MSYTIAVKVMRSHDYCHFEVALGATSDDKEARETLIAAADSLRKDAAPCRQGRGTIQGRKT